MGRIHGLHEVMAGQLVEFEEAENTLSTDFVVYKNLWIHVEFYGRRYEQARILRILEMNSFRIIMSF